MRAECVTLEGLIAAFHNSGKDGSERTELERKLTLKRVRLQELLQQRGLHSSTAFAQYGDLIRERLGQKED
ncbi:hypothetical protein PaeBR_15075 [Paenibacillus sp. BR2-3]|uniref:hypothetical protein n=1 Tax=Paenibacillus sp. BR2-3 TaxID=3048494 RepID=UPI0039779359